MTEIVPSAGGLLALNTAQCCNLASSASFVSALAFNIKVHNE
jgi:hypothetical protein